MSEIVDKWRSLQKGPLVPKPSEPSPLAGQGYVPATASTTTRRELTAQEFGGLYPQLVSKRPELLNRLARRGVTYYLDPLLEQKKGYGGEYSPSSKNITLQTGMGTGEAAHEVVHAEMATSWVNPVRFLVNKRYRAARMADLAIAGDKPIGRLLQLYFLATGGIEKAALQSESFAMGAYGSGAYPDIPVDYTDANRLFGGSFEGR